MARIHGANGRIYVDQYNLSGRTNQWDLNMRQGLAEVTAFEDTADTFVSHIGRRGWDGNMSAFADYTDDEIDEILHNLLNDTEHHVGLYANGAVAGSVGYEGNAKVRQKRNSNGQAGPAVLNLDFLGSSLMVAEATKLNEATVITGTGAQTGQQHRRTSAAADRILCVVRITGVTGAGSVTFKLEESSDNAVGDPYAEVTTMTAMTAVGSQSKTVVAGAALGPYFRINVTAFSGFTNVTLRAAVGIIIGG